MHLYETHLPVADTQTAEKFYREIVGLAFAYRDPSRDIVFMSADTIEKAMLGLWGPNTTYGKQGRATQAHHLAFAVRFDELISAITSLKRRGVEVLGFGGEETDEPTVIGWMPSAQIYFRDPDGHLVEFITILPDSPNPNFIGKYSGWRKLIEAKS
jgi:lactoylglutathione lyase